MGVLKLFASIVHTLYDNPSRASEDGLDEIAANAKGFAYIGNRRTLSNLVREEANELTERLRAIPDGRLEKLATTDSLLIQRIRAFRKNAEETKFDIVNYWYSREWEKDSGIFPDFLLALDDGATFGNGALLELKDSKNDNIASFNSTIPTRFKSLMDASLVMGSDLVKNAAQLYDFPRSASANYLTRQRLCFYLVRTQSEEQSNVRISLVEGSFFETLPKDQLLAQVWEQVLDAGGVSAAERPHIIELLASLEQAEIVRTREIEQASVKPRLRLMAEVHPDAKLHAYSEIKPRTVNLVIKRESGFDDRWLQREFEKEGVKVEVVQRGDEKILLLRGHKNELELRYFVILHKRNGEHIVLQHRLR